MQQLEQLGIEYKPMSKYCCACPKCADDRRKKNTKTLSVFIELPYIRYICNHPGCEWAGTKQQFIKVNQNEINEKEIQTITGSYQHIEESETPTFKEGLEYLNAIVNDKRTTLFPYRNREAKILFYILRFGDGDSKFIRPIAKTEKGDWVLERPKEKCLFRSETLRQGFPIIIVEGEKAAEAAAQIFTKADVVTWVGGANNIQQGDWDLLKGRKIILWPDNDEAGRNAMVQISKLLNSNTIHMATVSNLEPGADLGDNLPKEIIAEIWEQAVKTNIAQPAVRGVVKSDRLSDAFQSTVLGLPFGWAGLDKYVRLPTSGVVVVQSRTNHGKSAYMINIAANLLANTDTTVVYLSYEMSYKEILLRLTKTIDGKNYSKITFEDDLIYSQMIAKGESEAFRKIEGYIADNRFVLTDEQIDVDEIVELIARLKAQGKPVVVFVDYIQLVPSKNGRKDQRYLEVKAIAEGLRAAANIHEVVVVQGSQLTNGVDNTPFGDTARESKDIEFTAALVLKLWNKISARVTGTFKTKRGTKGEEDEEIPYYNHVPGEFVVEVKKTRQGETGRCVGMNFTNGCKLIEANSIIREF